MEIIIELQKPYTKKEKMDFIAENSHKKGYLIKETDEGLEAWGYTREEKEVQKQKIIDNLTMTPLDFIKFLQSKGLTSQQINSYMESNIEVKLQLTYCNNVYCGVAKQFMPLNIGDITISAEDVEAAFKAKNNDL